MIAPRLVLISFVLFSAAAIPGCKKKKKSGDEGDEKATGDNSSATRNRAPSAGNPMGDPVGDAHDPAKTAAVAELSAGDYEKLMLALEPCGIDGIRVSNTCKPARELAERLRGSMLANGVYDLAKRHIKHPSEAIRVHAASLMRSRLGPRETLAKAAVAAAASEKSPAVLAQIVLALRSQIGKDPAVAKLIMALSQQGSPVLRIEVAKALVSVEATGVEGALDTALKMAESDSDEEVRATACRNIGRQGDLRVLPLLTLKTRADNAKREPKLYVACWLGLVQLAIGSLSFEQANAEAFDVLVGLLAKAKCSESTPPWQALNPLAGLLALGDSAPQLKSKLPDLHKPLARVAGCKDASWIARVAAIDALAKTGADEGTFKALIRAAKKAKGDANAAKLIKKIESVRAKPGR